MQVFWEQMVVDGEFQNRRNLNNPMGNGDEAECHVYFSALHCYINLTQCAALLRLAQLLSALLCMVVRCDATRCYRCI